MADQFFLDSSDVRKLQKFYKQAPGVFKKMSANVLDSMAFADRLASMNELGKEAIIRNPKLLKNIMRVQMTKKNQPINQQFSISGSIEKPRHDAFAAIEEGDGVRITQFSDAGRGGDKQNVARKEAKAKQGASQRPSDYNLPDNQIEKFLGAVAGQKATGKYGRRKAFYLPKGHKRMGRGVYKFVGGKVGTYQGSGRKVKRTLVGAKIVRLSTPDDWVKPRKIGWKEKAIRRAITTEMVKRAWIKAGHKFLEKDIDRRFKVR